MDEVTTILVVDDDPDALGLLKTELEPEGYLVHTATNGDLALDVMKQEKPSLLLLDIMMPNVDGFQVCEQVRQISQVPIIVVSAVFEEDQKVKALDLGADDFVTKPFGREEIKARVKAALRRAENDRTRPDEDVFRWGDFAMEFSRRKVIVGGENVHLTPIEYGMLKELAMNCDAVVEHAKLLKEIWGSQYVDSVNYLHIHIAKLRKKLSRSKDIQIVTQSGVGYMLATVG